MTTTLWERPSNKRRYVSALIDLAVWTTVFGLVLWVTPKLAYTGSGRPIPTGRHPPDEIAVFSVGFSVLCANLYLAISNGAGRSVGKALTSLRLVVFAGPYPARPGFARGLVRSALQANLGMGGLMVATGLHDAFAGTKIVQASKWHASISKSAKPPQMAAWKIPAAVFLHLFLAVVDTLLLLA